MKCTIFLLLILPCYVFCDNNFDFNGGSQFFSSFIRARALSIIESSNHNTNCTRDLKILINDSFNQKLWALKMLDANFKLNPGILHGSIYHFGNYDECIGTFNDQAKEPINGQYCIAVLIPRNRTSQNETKNIFDLKTALNHFGMNNLTKHRVLNFLRIVIGICIPTSCTSQNLQNLIQYISTSLDLPLTGVVNETLCSYKDKPLPSLPIDNIIYTVLAAILAVVIVSTVYDLFLDEKDRSNNFGVIFSLHHNTKKLLSTSCENTSITCLYGIRTMTMMWIVLGHRYLGNILGPTNNALELLQNRHNLSNSFFIAGPLAVETFFVLSGALVTYVFALQAEKSKVSLSGFYIHRYIRLLPALGATILLYMSVIKFMSDGPVWEPIIKKFSLSCYHTWWYTLLFINNHIDPQYQCMEHTWYLSIDTQFYILSPIILYNIIKHPKNVITCMLGVSLASIAYTFYIAVVNNIAVLPTDLDIRFFRDIYQSTFCRVPTYMVGVCVGYFIYKNKTRQMRISKPVNLMLWTLTIAVMVMLILSHVTILAHTNSRFISAAFHAFVKPMWGIAVGYVIFACCTGHGGFINSFLSNPVFIVLGKLTYSMYLVHIVVQVIFFGAIREAHYFRVTRVLHDFIGDYVISVLFSVIMCLLFESPVTSFMKVMGERFGERKNMSKLGETKNGVKKTDKKIL